jgi:hypothetical protein
MNPPKRLCSRPAWRKRFRVQHKTLPIPRHESKHPAPACQPASQTDVIDAHNMAIIAQPMENARQDPDRTTLSASRGTPLECFCPVLWRIFPPLFSQANSSIDCPSHFASYPAISFPIFSLFALTLPSSFHASSLSFLQIRSFNLIRFNRAHLQPFLLICGTHSLFAPY